MTAAPDSSEVPFVGLTGAIAAGKSEALAALERLGASTLSADLVVHELLGAEQVRDLLVDRWGEEAVPAGAVDRDRVSSIVFERPDELKWLESVLHPRVARRMIEWRAGLDPQTKLAVVEVPLLFETGMGPVFDATISVVAPDEIRAARAGARRITELDARAGLQLSQDEKAARSTYVVENAEGLAELERSLSAVVDEIVATGAGEP